MNADQLAYFRRKLENLRELDRSQVNSISEGLHVSLQESLDELSLYDNHPGDVGDATFEREKDLGFKQFYEDRLAMIDDALEAIQKGTYGTCSACGQEIKPERLNAVPYTKYCLECKSQEEEQEHQLRPLEEDRMQLPFGGKVGGSDEVGFDGEDAWQAVARYGTSESPSDIGSVTNYAETYYNSQENIGVVEDYESIPTYKSKDGSHYQDFGGGGE